MVKEIKWGIIGFGQIAREQVAPVLAGIPGATLVGIFDCDESAGRTAASHYNCRYYKTLDGILSDPDIDVVYIATPNVFHYEQTLAAAKQKKHILCEKPMALNTLQSQTMAKVCHDHGVKLGIGYMGRFNSYNNKARELILQNKIGTIKYIHGYFSFLNKNELAWRFDPAISGGGPIMDLGIHLINLLNFLMPVHVAEIMAIAASRGKRIELTSAALLKFDDDVICELECSFEIPLMEGFEIYGDSGNIVVTNSLFQGPGGTITVSDANTAERLSVIERNPYVEELVEMMAAIRQGKEPSICSDQGINDVRIAEAWIKSMNTGQRIIF
jgi:predicted dehydrogenase